MNEPASAVERSDGYIQDPASQQVAAAVGAGPGERVLDVCAGPGGKATALAATGARVVAVDVHRTRAGLVRANAVRLRLGDRVDVLVADGTRPPFPPPGPDRSLDRGHDRARGRAFDRVLVDAPCSGLGTLRRRPDLRWRVDEASVERLAGLQRRLLKATADLLRPGGTLVYSVCTLTTAESVDVDAWLATERPDLAPSDPLGAPWEPWGRGAMLLPQTAGTDGMCLFHYVRRAG